MESNGSGTIYLAGTVCFVENGPYVARMEIGCDDWKTVNLSTERILDGVDVDGSTLERSGIAWMCCFGVWRKKNPPSLFSKWTSTPNIVPGIKRSKSIFQ